MERSFLEGFGLDKDQINKILDQASIDIGKAIDKKDQEITTLKADINEKDTNLQTAQTTINELKSSNTDNSKLQKQIEEYQKQIQQQTELAQKERIGLYIDLALTKAGAINPKTVIPLIDMNKIQINQNNEIIGIDEQINAIKGSSENAFLFGQVTQPEPTENTSNDRNYFGGYNPLSGETTSESFGTLQGQRAKKQFDDQNTSVAEFWNSCENGRIK